MFSFIRRKNFYGIYLQYQNANKFQGLDQFQEILNRITGKHVPILIVDTGRKEPPIFESSNYILSNNSKREFSGYQTGIEHLNLTGKLNNQTIIFIANDTFNVNYAGSDYLNLFLNKRAKKEILRGNLVGYVDRLGEDVQVIGRKGSYWVRTSFFSVSFQNLLKLLPFGQGFETEELFSDAENTFFSSSNLISENYKSFLKAWLFKEKNNFKISESWHSASQLTHDNFLQFKIKAQCIFSEFIFSQDALAKNIKIFDVRSIRI